MNLWKRLELEWKILLLAAVVFVAFAWPVQRLYVSRLTETLGLSVDPALESMLREQLRQGAIRDTGAVVASIERSRQWRALIPIVVREQQRSMVAFSVALSVMLFLAALWTLKRLTRPLKNLAVALERIGKGGNADIVPVSGGALGTVERAACTLQEELAVLRERARVQGMETAWQEIARVMAHEIKNPLTPIRLSLDAMEERIASDGQVTPASQSRFVERINTQVDNLERLVNQFRSFSREPEMQVRQVRLRQLVEAVAHDMAKGLHTTVKGDAAAAADPYLLNQVLLNLWKNALEAGATAVSVEITHGGASGRGDESAAAGPRVTIRDNGPGIGKADLQRVWLPYVTLKKGGTGLGLPVVRKLVETMGGSVDLTSAEGKGTTVTVVLKAPAGAGDGP